MADDHWSQPITRIAPNTVALRGYRVDELMGSVSYSTAVFIALRGRMPSAAEGRVLDAVLVASIDHGATPPSALAARTVASTGASLTTAVAAGIMSINRYHGGAIEGCMQALRAGVELVQDGVEPEEAARRVVSGYRAERRRIPGYGHRVHSNDPRASRLFAIARESGLAGGYVTMAGLVRDAIGEALGRDLPLNVDGAIAAVLGDMDFPPEMGNGLFAISRAAGLTAHVFDEITSQRPMRRISPTAHTYSGPAGPPEAEGGDQA
jgi:citrate synthase